jgi:hypothetical protein
MMPSLTNTFHEHDPVQFTPCVERTTFVVAPPVAVEDVALAAALSDDSAAIIGLVPVSEEPPGPAAARRPLDRRAWRRLRSWPRRYSRPRDAVETLRPAHGLLPEADDGARYCRRTRPGLNRGSGRSQSPGAER